MRYDIDELMKHVSLRAPTLVWSRKWPLRYQSPYTIFWGVDSARATYAPHTTVGALKLETCIAYSGMTYKQTML